MKLKSDFVTNSSSSSFIVIFEKKVVDFEDVQYLISGEAKARQVLKDALTQKPMIVNSESRNLIQKISKELTYGYMDMDDMDYSKIQDRFCEREGITHKQLYDNYAWSDAFYQEYSNMKDKWCIEKAFEFLKQHDGKYLYIFHYGDEDGTFFSEMEHGFTFERLPHITISKH